MEEPRKQLDLPAPDAELELAAAVERDPLPRRSGRRTRRAATTGPNRDGLELRHRGANGSASTSAHEWIGASQVIRSR